MNKSRYYGSPPTLGGMILQHVIVFLIGVVFPGLVTLFAPASWLTLECHQEKVSCTARTCMFFVVPFKTQHVDPVMEFTDRERAGKTEKASKYGRDSHKRVHVDGEGFLEIRGFEDEYAEVSVSPTSLKSVVSKAQNFLNAKQEGSTTIFAIANWKFGGLMGGVLTSLTLLCVVGYSLGAIKFILGLPGRIFRGSTTAT
jgi:hypothetical protein